MKGFQHFAAMHCYLCLDFQEPIHKGRYDVARLESSDCAPKNFGAHFKTLVRKGKKLVRRAHKLRGFLPQEGL